MNREGRGARHDGRDVPRERGDEPSLGMGRKIWGVCSPRARG